MRLEDEKKTALLLMADLEAEARKFSVDLDGISYIKGLCISYMGYHIGGNYRALSDYNSSIGSNCYKVVMRVGYNDANGNGEFDFEPDGVGEFYDFHWWYQTNSGQWADKPGTNPSRRLTNTNGSTNPVSVTWVATSGGITIYYNSSPAYFEIDDLRSLN